MILKLANLTQDVSESDLTSVCSEFGPIEKISVVIDPATENIFALVETNDETGNLLIRHLNNDLIKGRPIQITPEM